jgi:DMSO reductase anchor subunit
MNFADTWEMIYTIGAYLITLLLGVVLLGAAYATFEQFRVGIKLLRRIVLIIFLFFISCASPQKQFYNRKYPHETRKSYSEKRGLMLLNNSQLGRNKYGASPRYQSKLKKSYKKYHK